MVDFKVGDRVRLAGDKWEQLGDPNYVRGTLHTVTEIDGNGDALAGSWWILPEEGFDAELVSGDPVDVSSLLKKWTADQLIKPPVTSEEVQAVASLGDQLGIETFEQNVRRHLDKIGDLLVSKNRSYGDSALNPIRVFSRADRLEQLSVRIDDKLSRIQRGTEFEDEDTERDLIGYLILRLIAKESE